MPAEALPPSPPSPSPPTAALTPSPPTAAPSPSPPTAAPSPSPPTAGRSGRDMALSMLVLLIPLALLVGAYRLLGNEQPPTVDTAAVYDSARAARSFDVATLDALPQGWRVTSATFRQGVLRLGVTSPSGGAFQVVQSAAAADPLVAGAVGASARPDLASDHATTAPGWRRYIGGRAGETALVLATPGRTIIVVGRGSADDVRAVTAVLAE